MIEDDDPYADLKRHRMTPELQQIIDRARAEKKQRNMGFIDCLSLARPPSAYPRLCNRRAIPGADARKCEAGFDFAIRQRWPAQDGFE